MDNLEIYAQRLESLVVFRGLLNDPLVASLLQLLRTAGTPEGDTAYADFSSLLYHRGANLTRSLCACALEDENDYLLRCADREAIPKVMRDALENELCSLEMLSHLTSAQVKSRLLHGNFLPDWETGEEKIGEIYHQHLADLHTKGFGIFAKYHMFMVSDTKLSPVACADTVTLSQLTGYERERERVIENTKALLAGRPANNVLLYGDAGTGKSSTVKAVANAFAKDGLRLIEVKKNQLSEIPAVIGSLAHNPLKFILFIDDLSFSRNDDNFAALKAILEGSVAVCASNLAVYATSNRRHLIKESFSDRMGDEVHQNDTLEELRSLSARFGLTVTFERPDKSLYLQIVEDLAARFSLTTPRDQLFRLAEAYALRAGGRTPRAAEQFIRDYMQRMG